MKLHEYVNAEVKAKGLNANKLAIMMGMDRSPIYRFLKGHRKHGGNILFISNIFKALNLDMNKIYELEI